jgi:DNA-directed RNA polymerase subunit RPC12/RpoP
MDIFTVVCPECKKDFYGDMLLYSLKVELHCPYCGKYFFKEESPRVFTGGTGASAVAQVPGGLSLDMIYRPREEDQ